MFAPGFVVLVRGALKVSGAMGGGALGPCFGGNLEVKMMDLEEEVVFADEADVDLVLDLALSMVRTALAMLARTGFVT